MPDAQKPVRKIRPGRRSTTGKFASKKTGSTHYFESTLERDYLSLLEADPQVKTFLAQPVTIRYPLDGKMRRYTPDVLVHFNEHLNQRTLLVEIKYTAELQLKRSQLQPRFDAAKRYAEDRGFDFAVVTENQIRTAYLDNLTFLSKYSELIINAQFAEYILDLFNNTDSLAAGALFTGEDPQRKGKMLYTLWQMVSAGILMCNMESRITMTTLLWKNNNYQTGL